MKHILLPFLCSIFLATACGNTQDAVERHYTLDDFLTVQLQNPEQIVVNDVVLGRPWHIRFVDDGHILLLDHHLPGGQLMLIDTQTGDCEIHVRKGRGPGETLSSDNVLVSGDYVWLASGADNKILKLDKSLDLVEQYVMNRGFMRAVPYGDDKVLALSSGFSGNRFDLFGLSGELLDTLRTFPILKDSPNLAPDNAFLQSEISVSPDSEHVVVACHGFEYIDVYDSDMNLSVRITGPNDYPQEVVVKNFDRGFAYIPAVRTKIYGNLITNEDGLWVGYIGILLKKNEDNREAQTILTFDWEGRPQKAYLLDVQFSSFDVDWATNTLYCLTEEAEPRILKYQL